MTSTERLQALVSGKPVDRICHSTWWHMPMVDKNPKDLAKATIDFWNTVAYKVDCFMNR